jgi:hypothetical protein
MWEPTWQITIPSGLRFLFRIVLISGKNNVFRAWALIIRIGLKGQARPSLTGLVLGFSIISYIGHKRLVSSCSPLLSTIQFEFGTACRILLRDCRRQLRISLRVLFQTTSIFNEFGYLAVPFMCSSHSTGCKKASPVAEEVLAWYTPWFTSIPLHECQSDPEPDDWQYNSTVSCRF